MKQFARQHRMRLLLLLAIVGIFALAIGWRQPQLAAQEIEDKLDTTGWTEAMFGHYRDARPAANNPFVSAIPCVGGMAGSFPCENVNLLANMPHNTIGGGTGNDIWGWTDPLDGSEYAIVGQTNGTAFVDITDPENPVYVGRLPSHTGNSSIWRDMKTYADHVFIVADGNTGHGMQVFDLTELRTAVPPTTFSNTAHYPGVSSSHNIAINEDTGYAYIVGSNQCSGGLHMVDISDPVNPTFAGCYSGDGYTHDVQCVIYSGPDVTYQGDEICFAANEDTLTIVNVTNKAAPVQLARVGMSGSAYTHQGWLTENQEYFLIDDELDEQTFGHNTKTYLWDVSDLNNPVNFDNYFGPVTASDHNLYVRDNYAFQSNYSSGTRIVDISDIASGNPVQVGFFDTYPPNNNASFEGQWSNYPYFESGVVISNDRSYGLFILQPILGVDYTMSAADDSLAICGDGSANTLITLTDNNGYVGSVTLSALGLPAGASADFTPNPVVVPGDSDMELTTSGVAGGTYPFVVNGDDGTISRNIDMTLQVSDEAPDAPALTSPPNGATDVSLTPTYQWSGVDGATSYFIEVATDEGFTNVVDSATVETTSYNGGGLSPNTDYFWRVTAGNVCGGNTSDVWSFTTGSSTLTCNAGVVGFEDGNLPPDWYIETNALPGGEWVVSTDNSSAFWDPGPAPEGTYYASANDDLPGSGSDGSMDYLYTGVIDLSAATGATLGFWYHFDGTFGHAAGGVQVSDDGGATWDPEIIVPIGDSWQSYNLSLDAYAGNSNVQVRFHSNDGGFWAAGYAVDAVELDCEGDPTPTPTPQATDVELSQFTGDKRAADWVLWLLPVVILIGMAVYVYQRRLERDAG